MERREKRSPGGEAQLLVPLWRSTWWRDPPLITSDIHSTIVVVVVGMELLDQEVRAPELVRCFCFVGLMLICRKKKKVIVSFLTLCLSLSGGIEVLRRCCLAVEKWEKLLDLGWDSWCSYSRNF